MRDSDKSSILTSLALFVCGLWLILAFFKLLKLILTPFFKVLFNSGSGSTSRQDHLSEYEAQKAVKKEGTLNHISRVLAWFTGFLSILLLISAVAVNSEAWKPGVAFGALALLLYVLSKDTAVKDLVKHSTEEKPDRFNKNIGNKQFPVAASRCDLPEKDYTIEIVHHCSICGTEVKQGMNFCPGCGDNLDFFEDPHIKIKDGKFILEGRDCKKRIQDKNLKVDAP